ncbi:MAG: glycosyltransferase family 25 protein [Planctomycetales bacterium]|nr:glycosyltransferase family 25 protein [Planctomycetales bacterium]
MDIHFLNLDRRTDRQEQFLRHNSSIGTLSRISATDGSQLDREQLVKDRVIEPDLAHFSPGAIGNAVSHYHFWQRCAAGTQPVTIAEDDAVFNYGFAPAADKVLQQLPAEWDIILWGFNFNSILHVGLFDGLNESVLHFSRSQLGDDQTAYQRRTIHPTPLRLVNAFGLVCYSISPGGARRLLERCFPLCNELVSVPGLKAEIHNMTLDTEMNRHFGSLEAFVCFPPLVWTENDRTQSDVCSEAISD